MIVNYKNLCKKIKGTSVPKPLSGTLSGHAAGEPFDKHVYAEIKKQFPKQTFNGTREQWAKLYLKHFVIQAKRRANDMITKFVKPFEKYIE